MHASAVSSSLLALVALGACAALPNCSAPPEDGGEDLAQQEITGANNGMGLRLTYDETSGTVRATVRTRLRASEKLRLRVRRGRLSIDSQLRLDCNELPEAPPLPPAEDGP